MKDIERTGRSSTPCAEKAGSEAINRGRFIAGASDGKGVDVRVGIGFLPPLAARDDGKSIITAPVLLKMVSPLFPEHAPRHGYGSVTVHFIVGADGVPSHVAVKSTSDPVWVATALDAVRQYRFFPATKDGKFVASDLDIDVTFDRY